MSAAERAAEVLATHAEQRVLDEQEHCVCGWDGTSQAEHQAEALSAAGLLAEPTDQDQGEDFRSRLVAAAAELESMADISGLAESSRLSGKADGVRLALSYWDETTRAPSPSP